MNRPYSAKRSAPRPIDAPALESLSSGVFSSCEADDHPSAVFAPLHYEPGYAYPLLVWLHGPGDDESQLRRIMPHVSLRNYVAVSMRGTLRVERVRGKSGYGWSQRSESIALAEERLDAAIARAVSRYHVAPQRIFLAGFGCGGTMALRLAMLAPWRFAGAASFCGEFPQGRTPLSQLAAARRLPLLVCCGRESEDPTTMRLCGNLRLLHAAGIEVCLRQYPGGAQLSPLMLSDLDRWAMRLVTGSPAPAPA